MNAPTSSSPAVEPQSFPVATPPGAWKNPAVIARNNFALKSLSCWSYNVAVGCLHACRFCYVPEVSTNRMASKLKAYGVNDPDAEWGSYNFLRQWDEQAFLASLRKAENTPLDELNADGNRAVMLCTTTDPYQVVPREQQAQAEQLVTRALELLLTRSTLRVRILTRSPLARRDFELMKLFGERLMFGMSIPTLNNQLARVYEPKAPAPQQRLSTLRAARDQGIPIFVAVAPVYPECDAEDMHKTLNAVAGLAPHTVFMEPINMRADNVARIGAKLNTSVFATKEAWAKYSFEQMNLFQTVARDFGIGPDVLHLWPDKSLERHATPAQTFWLHQHWAKISAWPTQ